MIAPNKQYLKKLCCGEGGKYRVYYSDKFKRVVVEKTVNDTFFKG